MKKLMITAILVLSQVAFAAAEVKRMSKAEATTKVESSELFKRVEKELAGGKGLAGNPVLAKRATDTVAKTLEGTGVSVKAEQVMNLINIDAKTTMIEIARLSSIIKDTSSNPREVKIAKKALELLVLAGNSVEALTKNKDAKTQQTELAEAIDLSVKIASFDYNKKATDFQAAYKAALESGKSVSESIKEAGLTVDQIKACEAGV